jgi:Ca-activated chloride channel homolog
MNKEVKLTAGFDRNLVSEGGDSIRYLFVQVNAPSRTFEPGAAASPLNLAVVIDSSRSMYGERLNSAIRATADIIEGLSDQDFISIISFSNNAVVHVDGTNCDDWGKRFACEALKNITLGAGTNISEGWFMGAECVGAVMQKHPNCKNHVLLLSDGHANQGTLEPAALTHHAGELQHRGLTASAVGIGEGYSTCQLYAIAQYGGGRIHHATHPPEIVEVVMGELDELRDRLIENLVVSVSYPPAVVMKSLNIIPCEMKDGTARCIFGGLSSGLSRSAVFRVGTAEGRKNQELELRVSAQWRESGDTRLHTGSPCLTNLTFAPPEKNAVQKVDHAASLSIARLWQSWIVWQATNLNRMRDYTRLERLLTREIKFFRRFCRTEPAAGLLLAELEELDSIARQDWDETSRKEIQTSTYTSFYNLKDSRQKSRKWQAVTGEIRRIK